MFLEGKNIFVRKSVNVVLKTLSSLKITLNYLVKNKHYVYWYKTKVSLFTYSNFLLLIISFLVNMLNA